MTWTEFRLTVREHWKAAIGISVALVIIIVTIITVLVVVLKRDESSRPSPSISIFNGPDDINGDPNSKNVTFGSPQIITNPFADVEKFGQRFFVHEAGFICATATVKGGAADRSVLVFYYTNLQGNLEGPQRIDLYQLIPEGMTVCNGMFAPIFNRVDEVYYLFLSLGTVSSEPTPGQTVYASHVVLFVMDTSTGNLQWQPSQVRINSAFQETLSGSQGSIPAVRIPIATFQPDAKTPWIGTFGDKLQVVLDDNETTVKQSLYVRGSEFDPDQPGGNLYWFILGDNSTEPQLTLTFVIQDAKLLLLRECWNNTLSTDCQSKMVQGDGKTPCVPLVKTAADYINGFASDFFVSSGNGKANVLVAANSTGEDYCALPNVPQAASPKGYVQGYLVDSSSKINLGWIQPEAGSQSSQNFFYRYLAEAGDNKLSDGFGSAVSWLDNVLLVGQATPNSAGNAEYLTYNWTQTPNENDILSRVNPGGASGAPSFPQTPLYRGGTEASPAASQRYNLTMKPTNDLNNVLFTSWFEGVGNVISLQQPVLENVTPFSAWVTNQSLGAEFSSQPSTANPPITRFGFAQGTATWLSRTGLSVRIAFNDPAFNSFQGRFIVMSKSRSV